MVFSSLLFVFLFLPLSLLVYNFADRLESKNNVLLIFSLIFYAWAGPKYLLLLLSMVFINWFAGMMMSGRATTGRRKAGLALAITGSLGLLCYFKYTGFFLSSLQALTGFPETVPEIVLPIGISFYTFQLLSYSIDVYRGDVKPQRSYKILLLYASLFHQCIAGPIVRYSDVEEQILNRRVLLNDISEGINRFTAGLAKKTLLANTCASVCSQFIPDGADLSVLSGSALWMGMIMYTFQIYFDFSAYSDMAIGMGKMVGFHYRENFDYPYMSVSVSEFWRRWHISLGSFFRDYVYIPLGGNRRGTPRTILNLFVVWALTGLWHGASWNYVLWGLYFFVFIACEKLFLGKALKHIPRIFSHLYLLIAVLFGWVLFKYENLADGLTIFRGMFCLNENSFVSGETNVVILNYIFFIALCFIAATPLSRNLMFGFESAAERSGGKALVRAYGLVRIALPVLLLVLSAMSLVGNSYNPFLYFRF